MKPLVECVPNFSEGRDRRVIAEIVAALRSVPEVQLLDLHSDPDHNRSVATLVGPPAAVQEAAFRAIARAAELIDMDGQQGEHPRLGATDVVPFIPVRGVTMEECVALAHGLGQRVGAELGLPVYFYERAALRPERERLENVRRGEYEGLKVEIATIPGRSPDAGPAEVGKAGAVIIGARDFLIAFNVYLDTPEVEIAHRIARAVRHSSGGYRYVKALGMLVAGQAQVSMNLTHYRRTPIHRVVESIRREAARYGARITHTELVGLVPEAALVDAARWYLQLERFEPEQLLERRLETERAAAPFGYLDALAAARPTPGGGATAALAGALGAALAEMVGRVTQGRPDSEGQEVTLAAWIDEAEALRTTLTARVDEDSTAYEAVLAAYALPRETEEQQKARTGAIERALEGASDVPLATARDALRALELTAQLTEEGYRNAVTDAATGAWLAQAAVQSAALAVRANVAQMRGEGAQSRLRELESLTTRAERLIARAHAAALKRL